MPNSSDRPADVSRILICAPGSSAETVTLALAWFHVERRLQFDEVHLVASSSDADLLRRRLLGSPRRPGMFERACSRLHVSDAPYLSSRTIHGSPNPLGGKAAQALVEATADGLWQLVHQLCSLERIEISIVTSAAAGIYGPLLQAVVPMTSSHAVRCYFAAERHVRHASDSADHVDVHEAGSLLDASLLPTLVEVPVALWTSPPNDPTVGFSALARRVRTDLARLCSPDAVHIRVSTQEVVVADHRVRLSRALMFWYAALASLPGERLSPQEILSMLVRDRDGRISIAATRSSGSKAAAWLVQLRRLHHVIYRMDDSLPGALWRACGAHPLLPSLISKINARLKRELGAGAEPYLVSGARQGGYRLTLDALRVRVDP